MSDTGATIIPIHKALLRREERRSVQSHGSAYETSAGTLERQVDIDFIEGGRMPLSQASGVFADVSSQTAQLSKLLADVEERLAKAETALSAANEIEAADSLSFCSQPLAEAFCLRRLSEGLAMAITAHRASLDNLVGVPNLEQIRAMRGTIRTLLRGPFIDDETALGLIDSLEDAGWRPFRTELSLLLDQSEHGADNEHP